MRLKTSKRTLREKYFFTRVLWLSLSFDNDFAMQNQPQFPRKGKLSQMKAMVIL